MPPTENHEPSPQDHARCAVITVSDTSTEKTDRSGTLTRNRLKKAGHEVARYGVVPNEAGTTAKLLDALTEDDIDAALFNGGAALTDHTFTVLRSKLDMELPGFGELFRHLSYEEVGAEALRLRAAAGLYGPLLVFLMPGAVQPVKRALDKLIIPQLKPLVTDMHTQRA